MENNNVYILYCDYDSEPEICCVSLELSKLYQYYFEEIIALDYDLKSYISEYGLTLPLNYKDKNVMDAFDNDIDASEYYRILNSVFVK